MTLTVHVGCKVLRRTLRQVDIAADAPVRVLVDNTWQRKLARELVVGEVLQGLGAIGTIEARP